MLVAALVAAVCLAQSPGPDFSQTFTPTSVGSYLEPRDTLLVAAAGPATPALAQAAASLEAALRGSGRADLVLNGKTLGDVVDLDDPSIVRRCGGLPVSHILVLRVFEAPGQPARAVATVYEKSGALVTAFSGVAGSELAPRVAYGPPSQTPGAGVSASTAKAVLEVASELPPNPAQQQFDEQYIGFDDWVAVRTGTFYSPTVVARRSEPYLGKYRRPLPYTEFYDLVGRPDLSSSYRARSGWRTGLYIAGAVAAIGTPLAAVTYTLLRREDCTNTASSNAYLNCVDRRLHPDMTTGITVSAIGIGAGLTLMAIPYFFIDPQPVDAAETRKLAEDYNQRLKLKLGLARAGHGAGGGPPQPALELTFGTFRAPGGGGLLLHGRF